MRGKLAQFQKGQVTQWYTKLRAEWPLAANRANASRACRHGFSSAGWCPYAGDFLGVMCRLAWVFRELPRNNHAGIISQLRPA